MMEQRLPLTLKTLQPIRKIEEAVPESVVLEKPSKDGNFVQVTGTNVAIKSTEPDLRSARLFGGITMAVILALFALTFWMFVGQVEGGASRIFEWFPPWFGGFNAWLVIAASAIPVTVTLSYVYTMQAEKSNRLLMQFKDLPLSEKAMATVTIEDMFKIERYIGAMAAATIVSLLGTMALLFFKPMGEGGTGIDLSTGANLLLVASAVREDGATQSGILDITVTAYTFGFLGAWLYFVTSLMRGFFNCDLRPRTLIAGAIRMTTASVVALVVGLAMHFSGVGGLASVIVPVAFIIGHFPERGLGFLNALVGTVSRYLAPEERNLTPLGVLPGMSYGHAQRLRFEGIDSVEDLPGQHPILLTLQTGFPFPTVEAWIGEAWLRRMLGNDGHAEFAAKTGLRGKYELRRMAWRLAEVEFGAGKASQPQAIEALRRWLVTAIGEEKRAPMQAIAAQCLYFRNWDGVEETDTDALKAEHAGGERRSRRVSERQLAG